MAIKALKGNKAIINLIVFFYLIISLVIKTTSILVINSTFFEYSILIIPNAIMVIFITLRFLYIKITSTKIEAAKEKKQSNLQRKSANKQ